MQQCRKRKYKTDVDAMLALARVQRKRNIDELEKYERSTHWCEHHQAWHLTSWRTEEG